VTKVAVDAQALGSVFGDPAPGDVFTANHLAVWNGFTATVGGGNDTFASLLPGGDSPFAVYMPAGIVITKVEWTNQTPNVHHFYDMDIKKFGFCNLIRRVHRNVYKWHFLEQTCARKRIISHRSFSHIDCVSYSQLTS